MHRVDRFGANTVQIVMVGAYVVDDRHVIVDIEEVTSHMLPPNWARVMISQALRPQKMQATAHYTPMGRRLIGDELLCAMVTSC
jgi:hypothetical protein